MDELLTVKQAAQLLKVNVNKVYELRDSGELRMVKLGAWKVRRKTLESFIERLEELGND